MQIHHVFLDDTMREWVEKARSRRHEREGTAEDEPAADRPRRGYPPRGDAPPTETIELGKEVGETTAKIGEETVAVSIHAGMRRTVGRARRTL